jgi:hypothetical protein
MTVRERTTVTAYKKGSEGSPTIRPAFRVRRGERWPCEAVSSYMRAITWGSSCDLHRLTTNELVPPIREDCYCACLERRHLGAPPERTGFRDYDADLPGAAVCDQPLQRWPIQRGAAHAHVGVDQVEGQASALGIEVDRPRLAGHG